MVDGVFGRTNVGNSLQWRRWWFCRETNRLGLKRLLLVTGHEELRLIGTAGMRVRWCWRWYWRCWLLWWRNMVMMVMMVVRVLVRTRVAERRRRMMMVMLRLLMIPKTVRPCRGRVKRQKRSGGRIGIEEVRAEMGVEKTTRSHGTDWMAGEVVRHRFCFHCAALSFFFCSFLLFCYVLFLFCVARRVQQP